MEKPHADSAHAETAESVPSDVPPSELQRFDDHVTAKTWLVVFVRRSYFLSITIALSSSGEGEKAQNGRRLLMTSRRELPTDECFCSGIGSVRFLRALYMVAAHPGNRVGASLRKTWCRRRPEHLVPLGLLCCGHDRFYDLRCQQ